MSEKDEESESKEQKWLLEKTCLSTLQDLSKLTKLDLPKCDLTSLPSSLPRLVPNLSILFCPMNKFEELPAIVGECLNLQMVSFKDNGMTRIHPDALQPQLKWLILTGNAIGEIPETIGRCKKLQKLMLSGNSLTSLPGSIHKLENLELVRLAGNNLAEPPLQLLQLPNLRWIALSGNPFLADLQQRKLGETSGSGLIVLEDDILEDTAWPVLGRGASGITRKVTWKDNQQVAVKTFMGALTSDGSPQDERAISVAASSLKDPSLIQLLGQTSNGSLVMELLQGYDALAGPPSFATCSRDVYPEDMKLSEEFAWSIAMSLLCVLQKLHTKTGICHGDFYGHNILISLDQETVKLSDFGAAFFYDKEAEYGKLIRRVELRSYAVLVQELKSIAERQSQQSSTQWEDLECACNQSDATFDSVLSQFLSN